MSSPRGNSGHGSTTSEHWSRKARERVGKPDLGAELNWLDSKIVLEEYINPAISGLPQVGWFEWVMDRYVPPDAASFCNLGCGDGGLERHARFLGYEAAFVSFDISEGALSVARQEADRCRLSDIDYQQADLNRIRQLSGRYDVVFGCMSLHHISNLEQLFRAIDQALVPGGRLVFNEYIGPRKFQWTDLQLKIVNRILATLPPELREDRLNPGAAKGPMRRLSLEEMERIDPSEAALSDQIIPLACRYFAPLVIREYGGTVLHLLLERISGNFREDTPGHVDTLLDIIQLERILLKTKVLPSDFAVAVLQKS